MSLAAFSIRNPVLVTCAFLVILAMGWFSYGRLRTELYPDVSFPVVNVTVPYPGASPEEVETQAVQPIENAVSDLAGVRTVRSTSLPGAGIVTIVFVLNTDIHSAQQSVAEAIDGLRSELPRAAQPPTISAIDPSDVPLLTLALTADIPEDALYELAWKGIRPELARVPQAGLVKVEGVARPEVEAELDAAKLARAQMSATEVASSLRMSGVTVPIGEIAGPKKNVLVRSVGAFESLDALLAAPIRFAGNETPVTLGDVAGVRMGAADPESYAYFNGRRAVIFEVYRQRGADTLPLADALRAKAAALNAEFRPMVPGFDFAIGYDGTQPIREGVGETKLSLVIGAVLTIVVVLLFLGSVRSTLITGIALPNSILGAFLLMAAAGFSVNITTLAALSLAIGLLIDDAIVVRESIFRRIAEGEAPGLAAIHGTSEVALAVVATTLTVLSVFAPIAFLRGIIGQFFEEFGLTICFAMLISLLDSLTVAPMLSAHFAGRGRARGARAPWRPLALFERFQQAQERFFLRALGASLAHPLLVLTVSAAVLAGSGFAWLGIPKAFLPPSGSGEFEVSMTAPSGTSLLAMSELASAVDRKARTQPEVERTLLKVGSEQGQANQALLTVILKDSRQRRATTAELKETFRKELASFPLATTVQDIVAIGGGAGQPFVLHVLGENLDQLRAAADALVAKLRSGGDLTDIQASYRPGAQELKITYDPERMKELGVASGAVGEELRTLVSGAIPARLHQENGEYDVRLRLAPGQRDLVKSFDRVLVPNLNQRLVPLHLVARGKLAESPSSITRENRRRFIEISADLAPGGKGLSHAMQVASQAKLPAGMSFEFAGQTRDFQELLSGAVLAVATSVVFMYAILASLYSSFFIPLAIMLVLPLAICGAFYALAITGYPLEINSMIGCILLLGVAAKNSILLVDHIQRDLGSGKSLRDAIQSSARVRLRPILMTTFALIAGMLPVAIPWEEAARQRAGMAIAVIGGLVSSTLMTLFVIPAAYGYLLRLQRGIMRLLSGGR